MNNLPCIRFDDGPLTLQNFVLPGTYSSIRSVTEQQDVMAQMTELSCDFGGMFEENDMKAAMAWRDRSYDRKGY